MSKSLQNIDDKNKNNVLVNTIRNALSHLKDKIETITKIEKTSKEPDKIVDIVGKIFEFNRPNEDQQPDAWFREYRICWKKRKSGRVRTKNINTRSNA